jgi:RHS repeat-associated protein
MNTTTGAQKIFSFFEGGHLPRVSAFSKKSKDGYPFGQALPYRNGSSGDQYEYGFNGMRKDNELKGNNNSYDFGARLYDPRVGRWLSNDPDFHAYPSISPYVFCINSPMLFIDPNGNWVAKIVQNPTDGKYSLTFVAEEGDNLEVLATQLGLPKESILEKHPELENLQMTSGTELKLENLEQVMNINQGLNFIADNQDETNCADLADRCDGGTNVFTVSVSDNIDFFEGELGNNSEYTNEEIKKHVGIETDLYISVSDKDSRIGDVISYKLTPESEDALVKEMGGAAINVLKRETHFSVVVLKDKAGEKPAQIIQKNGVSKFDFKVDDANDNELPGSNGKVNYEPYVPKGTATTPINRRI